MKIKYVILDEAYPVIFGECNKHSDFKRAGLPTSAGFCSIHAEPDNSPTAICPVKLVVSCWGKSESLGIGSAPNDAQIIQRLFTP